MSWPLLLFASGIALGLFAMLAPARAERGVERSRRADGSPTYSALVLPADELAETYARLSESARCDLLLALAPPLDERSEQFLGLGLADASDAVALAAAHALLRAANADTLKRYVSGSDEGDRFRRLLSIIETLQPGSAGATPSCGSI